MANTDQFDDLTYVQADPEVKSLSTAYDKTVRDLDFFFQGCRENYDHRRNIWPGKSSDLRKNGSDAFPWQGAADTEAHVINERINAYIAIFMSALDKANIRAYPTEVGDLGEAKVVSSFLKWMVNSYIPQFRRQMELGSNYLLERGIMITYVGWQREDHTYKQKLTLDQIAQVSPDLAKGIMDKSADDVMRQQLQSQFPALSTKVANKALNDLRTTGEAEFPIVKRSVDCPQVNALSPDGDFLFPCYTTDPQKSPYCFWRTLMTAQELENKVSAEGWDRAWVDYVVEHCRTSQSDTSIVRRDFTTPSAPSYDSNELYEVIHGYRRLIDKNDNSEGIYCTVFNRNAINKTDVPDYASHELMNGYEQFPVVVTKLFEDNKRLYDIQSIPDLLKGIQWQVKVERDSRIDRNSLATVPPIMHPLGNPPAEWGPKAMVPYRRLGEFQFGPVPQYNPGSMEMETTQLHQADELLGLSAENPLTPVKQQYFVNKFLEHVRDVLRLAFKCYQRFGPDEVFFRVTGVPDAQKFNKGDPEDDYDINIDFDVLNHDPENVEAQLQQMVNLVQLDRNGRINMDSLLDLMAAKINPLLADMVLQPASTAQQQMQKDVTDDLSKIYAGIEVGARPNGSQAAIQMIQQYVQQPDVTQRLQTDKAFAARLKKYSDQYQMQIDQANNVQIGKLGTMPAQMGNVTTQGMNQSVRFNVQGVPGAGA